MRGIISIIFAWDVAGRSFSHIRGCSLLHRTAAMGLAPSSAWAQAVTDAAASAADLPVDRRVRFGQVCPQELPVWGSIVDDFWTIEEQQPGEIDPDSPAALWVDKFEEQLHKFGVPVHPDERGWRGERRVPGRTGARDSALARHDGATALATSTCFARSSGAAPCAQQGVGG